MLQIDSNGDCRSSTKISTHRKRQSEVREYKVETSSFVYVFIIHYSPFPIYFGVRVASLAPGVASSSLLIATISINLSNSSLSVLLNFESQSVSNSSVEASHSIVKLFRSNCTVKIISETWAMG